MLIWLENAPAFGKHCDHVTSFIDRIITREKSPEYSDLCTLVNRQVHRHSHTCKKNSQKLCRFNYPQPSMRSTQILYPLDIDMDDSKEE